MNLPAKAEITVNSWKTLPTSNVWWICLKPRRASCKTSFRVLRSRRSATPQWLCVPQFVAGKLDQFIPMRKLDKLHQKNNHQLVDHLRSSRCQHVDYEIVFTWCQILLYYIVIYSIWCFETTKTITKTQFMKMATLIKGLQLPEASPTMQPVGTLFFKL